MRCFRFTSSCALLFVLAAAGCGGQKLIPVEGTVSVKGKPADFVKGGTVTFHPDVEAGNKQTYAAFPTGKIDENGKYSLSTGGKPGAPPGAYKVTISVTAPSDPKNEYSVPKLLIDKTNTELGTTTLKKEVKAGAPAGQYDFALEK
jgi:hypothetical protein